MMHWLRLIILKISTTGQHLMKMIRLYRHWCQNLHLPSYPSEDAVVSGAAVEMMKLLFPTEIAYIEQKAEEQKLYRIMAGANTRGELDAGESLGKQVADVFAARARTDKAGAAIGTPAYWTQLQTQTDRKRRNLLGEP